MEQHTESSAAAASSSFIDTEHSSNDNSRNIKWVKKISHIWSETGNINSRKWDVITVVAGEEKARRALEMLFSPILCKQHEGSIQCFQPWAQLRFAISAFISTRLFALYCVYTEALSDPRLSSSSFPFLFVEFSSYTAASEMMGKKLHETGGRENIILLRK